MNPSTMHTPATRYQQTLELLSSLVMMGAMFWFAVVFLNAPSPTILNRLSEAGIVIPPTVFGVLCILGMFGYLLMLSPRLRRAAVDVKMEIFFICAVPILLYLLPVFFDLITQRLTLTPFIYFGIFLTMIVHGTALYFNYSRTLELSVAGILFGLFFLTSATFATMTRASYLTTVNAWLPVELVPMTFALYCLASAIGYALLPWVPLPFRLKRIAFALLSLPSALLALILGYNVLMGTGAVTNLLTVVTLIDLSLLLVLLGCALYRRRPAI